jgi:hypothetical protein
MSLYNPPITLSGIQTMLKDRVLPGPAAISLNVQKAEVAESEEMRPMIQAAGGGSAASATITARRSR